MAGDVGDAAGLLAELEVGRRIPDGDLPRALWQLRLLETHAAAFTHRSGCEQLDDVDRLDTLRPRFEIAEHLPHALLAGVDVDGLLKVHASILARLPSDFECP